MSKQFALILLLTFIVALCPSIEASATPSQNANPLAPFAPPSTPGTANVAAIPGTGYRHLGGVSVSQAYMNLVDNNRVLVNNQLVTGPRRGSFAYYCVPRGVLPANYFTQFHPRTLARRAVPVVTEVVQNHATLVNNNAKIGPQRGSFVYYSYC